MTLGSERLASITTRETPKRALPRPPALPDYPHGHTVTFQTECVHSKAASDWSAKQIRAISQLPLEKTSFAR